MKRNKKIRNVILAIVASIFIYVIYVGLKCYNDTNIVKEEESKWIITPIRFNFDNVIEVIYNPETNLYYIKYDDPDVFDYDNLAYHCDMTEWYGDYIFCAIDSNIAVQFNKDNITFNDVLDYYEKMDLNNKYIIIETQNNNDISWNLTLYNGLK